MLIEKGFAREYYGDKKEFGVDISIILLYNEN